MTQQLIDLARRRPSLWVRPGVAWLLTVALAYGGVLWMNVLHRAQGAHENNEPSLFVHWLRDATLALPIVFVAVWAGMLLCRRLLERTGARTGPVAGTVLLAASVAAATSAVLGLSNPLHGLAFGHHHLAAELPWPLHMARDALAAFPVELLVAVAAVAATARRQPWTAPAGERWALPSGSRARAGLRGAVALIVVGPSCVFAVSTIHATGDLFYGDLRRPFTQAGMWELIRVLDPADVKADLKPLG